MKLFVLFLIDIILINYLVNSTHMKTKSLLFCFAVALVVLMSQCRNKSLEFGEVKFNTPENVVEELGIKNLPEFFYVGNTTNANFNWDYWDCLVEFNFKDTLSFHDKENILKQVLSKDTLYWEYINLSQNGIAEFYNIKYSDNDTIPYNIVITNDKIYVAYNNRLAYYSVIEESLLNLAEYHILVIKNFNFGVDSEHEYVIQLSKPYIQYLDRFKTSEGWQCKETSTSIFFSKESVEDYYEIEFLKNRNIFIISSGNY